MYNRGSRKRDGKQGKKQEGWKNAEIGKTVGELHKNEADNQRKKSRKKLDKGEEDKDKERGQKGGRWRFTDERYQRGLQRLNIYIRG